MVLSGNVQRSTTIKIGSEESMAEIAEDEGNKNNSSAYPQQTYSKFHPIVTETPSSETCSDKFKNCDAVVQSSLCNYAYYQRNCCKSCRYKSP